MIGLSVAFHLAERGDRRVAVFERSGIAAEASGVQPGGVRQQWGTTVNCLMARESVAFYRNLAERLEPRTSPRLDDCGYLFLAHSGERLAQLEADVALQNRLGIRSQLLTPPEVAETAPGIDVDTVLGAAFCAEDGYFDQPQSVVEAFADAAVRLGATIRHADVVALEQDGAGWLLRQRDGGVARAGAVVVAAGCDTPALLRPLGVAAPIRKEPRYLFFSDPIGERLLDPLVVSAERRFAAKQLANGRVLASDLAAAASPERSADDWRRHVKEASLALLPLLEFVSYPLLVEGFYDLTPDHQAILGPVEGLDGLWLAAGFSGHGFMMAPSVGRCLAAGVAGEPLDPLIDPLLLRRFDTEGLVPEMQIV